MNLLDTAITAAANFGKRSAGRISQFTGKPENEIRQAIDKGLEKLPEVLNSKSGGMDVLRKVGVTPSFANDMKRKYGRYIDKIPGLSSGAVDGVLSALSGGQPSGLNRQQRRAMQKFDRSKYPRVNG